ncbi:MAG: cellulase family glycosylhydrolase, partial [Sedimentisphaerales bacterium]|nr:cellulase family glycosylhydrolase [Sedimentisphaerales bacterium]
FDPNDDDFYNNLLRPVVDYCASKDLYVIIDWHYIDDTYNHIETTSEFWEYMAPKFALDSHVIFELYNEPRNDTFGSDVDNWLSVRDDMQTWIDIVRSYAVDNLILVAGPKVSTGIGPIASYPVSDPVGGDNIAVVSHLYPGSWRNPTWYQNQIITCHSVYPIVMTEWGFSQSGNPEPDHHLNGTITDYGLPLMEFIEGLGISNTAWVASYDWRPPMFWTDWTLRSGEGEMGCFVKDMLYLRRNDWPGGDEGDATPPAVPTSLVAGTDGGSILLNWQDNTEGDLFGYYVYRSTSSGIGYSKLNTWPLGVSEYTDNTVIGGHTYYYVVTAMDDYSNESELSDEVSFIFYYDNDTGSILREWWTGISGNNVSDLTSNINYPDNPTGREHIAQLEGPEGWEDNYGARIRGYLYPPAGGVYTFWIASDNCSELWLSTNGDPANITLIAEVSGWTYTYEWDKYPEQESVPISLAAGQKYYIEVLHKEGAGGDRVAVAWSGPGITQEVISGVYLSPWPLGACTDLTGDGKVNIEDLAAWISMWLQSDCIETAGMDMNGDCIINLDEFSRLAQNWLASQ